MKRGNLRKLCVIIFSQFVPKFSLCVHFISDKSSEVTLNTSDVKTKLPHFLTDLSSHFNLQTHSATHVPELRFWFQQNEQPSIPLSTMKKQARFSGNLSANRFLSFIYSELTAKAEQNVM
jgi:carboxylesterase type B